MRGRAGDADLGYQAHGPATHGLRACKKGINVEHDLTTTISKRGQHEKQRDRGTRAERSQRPSIGITSARSKQPAKWERCKKKTVATARSPTASPATLTLG